MGSLYLNVCWDWMGHPMHSALHSVSICLVLVLFHLLFTCSKKAILANIWRYHRKHGQYESVMHIKHINGDDQSYINIANDGKNGNHIKLNEVNMDHIEESSIFLDASVSRISSNQTSVIEVDYNESPGQKQKQRNARRARLTSYSDLEDDTENVTDNEEY